MFNMLVGPVFSAGSVTSERERETLDLLLTTIITPWQILWGKLIAGLRVSSVLTLFLMWPVLLDAQTTSPGGTSPGNPNAAQAAAIGNWPLFFGYAGFSLGLDALLLITMMWLFNTRWRVAG